MTNKERIENVKSLGYSEREAAFVTLASLHAGYFLRRQYGAFSGKSWGWADDSLTAKLLDKGHAKELDLRRWRSLYSFHSKALFEALGEVDNRNRRLHEPQTIKARLMCLDHVISHPQHRWCATETERISLFTHELGIDREHLPVWRYESRKKDSTTLRWFVDKPPIYLSGSDSTVHICFADPGFHTADSFRSFLSKYRPLLTRLASFEVVYLAESTHLSERASRVFATIFAQPKRAPEDPVLADLLTYFRDRLEHESAGLAAFDKDRIDRYRDARKLFGADRYQRLFALWREAGDAQLRQSMAPDSCRETGSRGTFSTTLMSPIYGRAGRSSPHSRSSVPSSGSSSAPVASYV